jgi:hypothetical protein
MRRWFVLALAPTALLAAQALFMLSGGLPSGPSFIIDTGLLLALVVLACEVIALVWLGGTLLHRWPTTRYERWTLPLGVAGGFLPWTLLAVGDGAALLIAALAGWVAGCLAIASLVGAMRTRRAARWAAVAGGVVLVLVIPFLVSRAQFGPEIVPWWAAPLWTPASILGIPLAPVGATSTYEGSLVSAMVLFGSALYLATIASRSPSPVQRMSW